MGNGEVVEPTLAAMKVALMECRDVDDLMRTHAQYALSLQHQCLLQEKVTSEFPVSDSSYLSFTIQ